MYNRIQVVPARLGAATLPLLLLFAGCDRDPEQVWGEIEAARGDCTEEGLKASAEECVQMFERLADMGTDAMETYVGAMRALDQALQRRGGVMFDTTGLGRAITGQEAPTDSLSGDLTMPLRSDPSGGVDRWDVVPPDSRYYDPAAGEFGERPVAGTANEDPTAPYELQAQPSATPAARGQLLPPEQRLWRPWLDDAPPPDRYYPERSAADGSPEPVDAAGPNGWGVLPEELPPIE